MVVVGGLVVVVVVGGFVVLVGGFVVVVVRVVVVLREVDVLVRVVVVEGFVVVGFVEGPAVGDGFGLDGAAVGEDAGVTEVGAALDGLPLGSAEPVDELVAAEVPTGTVAAGEVAEGTAGAQPTASRTRDASRDRAPRRRDMLSPWASKLTGA